MNKVIFNILKWLNKYINNYCYHYIYSLSEKEQISMLTDDQKIDLECQKIRMANCKHKWIIICNKCGTIKEIDGRKNNKNKKSTTSKKI